MQWSTDMNCLCYLPAEQTSSTNGVRVLGLWAPRLKSIFIQYFQCPVSTFDCLQLRMSHSPRVETCPCTHYARNETHETYHSMEKPSSSGKLFSRLPRHLLLLKDQSVQQLTVMFGRREEQWWDEKWNRTSSTADRSPFTPAWIIRGWNTKVTRTR